MYLVCEFLEIHSTFDLYKSKKCQAKHFTIGRVIVVRPTLRARQYVAGLSSD